MSKHLESLHQNLLSGNLPHNLSWSEAVELIKHLGEVQPHASFSRSRTRMISV